jgi:hypothetical protein
MELDEILRNISVSGNWQEVTQVDKEENGKKRTLEDRTSHKISYTMLQLMGGGGGVEFA